MFRYECDGCDEIIYSEPPITLTGYGPEWITHFHSRSCFERWIGPQLYSKGEGDNVKPPKIPCVPLSQQ